MTLGLRPCFIDQENRPDFGGDAGASAQWAVSTTKRRQGRQRAP